MILYLLRHTDALPIGENGNVDDRKRPLSEKGDKRAQKVGQACNVLDLKFDVLLTSGYLRAKQTAELAATQFAVPMRATVTKTLASDADPRAFIQLLLERYTGGAHILAVGHEPFLAALAGLLLDTGSDSLVLKKGSLLALEIVEPLHEGKCARLLWSLSPNHLSLLAKLANR
ncbi:MAG: histidine phosphatase family protein [bacterium]|nr:histidine phosphatase family protein [bacterium]